MPRALSGRRSFRRLRPNWSKRWRTSARPRPESDCTRRRRSTLSGGAAYASLSGRARADVGWSIGMTNSYPARANSPFTCVNRRQAVRTARSLSGVHRNIPDFCGILAHGAVARHTAHMRDVQDCAPAPDFGIAVERLDVRLAGEVIRDIGEQQKSVPLEQAANDRPKALRLAGRERATGDHVDCTAQLLVLTVIYAR